MDLQKSITTYISDYYGWLNYYTKIVVVEFDKFMTICAENNKQLVGPQDIEKCWQALILDTDLYYNYCTKRFGKIIHYKILEIDSQTKRDELAKTYKLYLQKYAVCENKLVWSPNILEKNIRHNIDYNINVNIYSKSGKKHLTLTHAFNSVEIFGCIKELVNTMYNIPICRQKIYVCKLELQDFVINNVVNFYSLDSKLEILDQINISGLFNFGVKTFDLVIQQSNNSNYSI